VALNSIHCFDAGLGSALPKGVSVQVVTKLLGRRGLLITIFAGVVGIAAVWVGMATIQLRQLAAQPMANELADRASLKERVRRLLSSADYPGLDRLESQFRDGSERTSSGVWKLTVFYGAFQDAAFEVSRDDAAGWRALTASIDGWRQAEPASPGPTIAGAVILKARAATLRPRRMILEASTGAEARYLATLRQAAALLDGNKPIAALDPHFFAVRADLAATLSETPDSVMDLVGEARDRSPDYYPVYFSGLDYFASGTGMQRPDVARRIEAFANTAAQRLSGPAGEVVYARIYWHAYSAVYGNDLFHKSRADWARMRSGLESVLKQYPDAWNRNNFAYLACLQGDRETTRKLLDGVSGPPLLDVWKAKRFLAGCRSWANSTADKGKQ
jgi:hypothetical protein